VTHNWLVAGGFGDLDGVGELDGVGDCEGFGDLEGVGDADGVGVPDGVGVTVGVGVLVGRGVRDGVMLGVGVVLGAGSLVVVALGSGVAGGVLLGALELGDGLVALTEGDGEMVWARTADRTAAAGRWAHAVVAARAGLADIPASSRPDRPDVNTPIPASAPTLTAPRRVLTDHPRLGRCPVRAYFVTMSSQTMLTTQMGIPRCLYSTPWPARMGEAGKQNLAGPGGCPESRKTHESARDPHQAGAVP
jgi:hypothetical protein